VYPVLAGENRADLPKKPYPSLTTWAWNPDNSSEGIFLNQVRSFRPRELDECLEIVRGLPDFFTEDVQDSVLRDLQRHAAWVILEAEGLVGFLVAERRAPRAAEILWMAIRPDRRNAGYGTLLLDAVLRTLRLEGIAVVEVKTLDRSASYAPYEATRAFWEHRGFVQIDSIDPLPGWEPGNPSALYVAALITTR
jgi:GNAT superfamily N-acetyltransferase